MRPKVKYAVIHRHRDEYPVSVMCKFFGVSRSGYYDFVKRQSRPEADAELTGKIEECQNKTDKTYGYRRVWKWLMDRNIQRNPKTVLRIMKSMVWCQKSAAVVSGSIWVSKYISMRIC